MNCQRCNPWGDPPGAQYRGDTIQEDGHRITCELRVTRTTFPGKIAGKRDKYYCAACDHVAKEFSTPRCPFCGEPMRNMGTKWPVGRKGHRVPLLGDGLHKPSHGEVLLAHLNGTFETERKHWAWGW